MIKKRIQQAVFTALKAKKERDLKALRFILSLIQYEEIARKRDLSDEETFLLIQKEIKKRKEAIELFKKGKRNDLVEEEEQQIEVIKQYLPEQLSSEELTKVVDKIISASGEKNVGKIIGLVIKEVKGRTDGRTVSEIVKKKLLS